MSKYLVKLSSIYDNLNLVKEAHEKRGNQPDISDEFDIVHSYEHPTSKKKCHCMMRKHSAGYNIVDMDEDGNLVVDIFAPQEDGAKEGGEENAENISSLLGKNTISANDLALVRTLAGGQARGGLNPFDNPQKDIERAYGVLLKKLSTKIKNVANQIQA